MNRVNENPTTSGFPSKIPIYINLLSTHTFLTSNRKTQKQLSFPIFLSHKKKKRKRKDNGFDTEVLNMPCDGVHSCISRCTNLMWHSGTKHESLYHIPIGTYGFDGCMLWGSQRFECYCSNHTGPSTNMQMPTGRC